MVYFKLFWNIWWHTKGERSDQIKPLKHDWIWPSQCMHSFLHSKVFMQKDVALAAWCWWWKFLEGCSLRTILNFFLQMEDLIRWNCWSMKRGLIGLGHHSACTLFPIPKFSCKMIMSPYLHDVDDDEVFELYFSTICFQSKLQSIMRWIW